MKLLIGFVLISYVSARELIREENFLNIFEPFPEDMHHESDEEFLDSLATVLDHIYFGEGGEQRNEKLRFWDFLIICFIAIYFITGFLYG